MVLLICVLVDFQLVLRDADVGYVKNLCVLEAIFQTKFLFLPLELKLTGWFLKHVKCS